MAALQYGDLPQIPQNMDESRYPVWGAEHYSYMHSYKQHTVSFNCEDELCFEDFDSGLVSIPPLDRFMLEHPLAQGVLHTKNPLERHLGRQYEVQWPSADCNRNVSPDRGSDSSNSSYATLNELHSPHMYHAIPYGSPPDIFSQSSLPYSTTEHFKEDVYLSNPSLLGGSVNLRQLEYEHPEPEPEPAMEDINYVDLKQDTTCDDEHISVKMDPTPPGSVKDYTDSGIGNSVRDAESVQPIDLQDIPEDLVSDDSDYSPRSSRSSGKRRRSSTSSGSPRGVIKRSRSTISKASNSSKVPKRSRRASNTTKKCIEIDEERRPFPCPLAAYGCNSTFPSKNEWKRHVNTQHIKLSFWRCDLCPPTVDPNDDQTFYYNEFNRKDLFAQHLRRMHATPKDNPSRSQKESPVNEDNLQDHQKRCLKSLRKAPQQSICLFCDATFEGPSSWEERMEHVGRHLEKDRKSSVDMLDTKSWNEDITLEQYLLEEGLVIQEQGDWKIGDGKPRRSALGNSNNESGAN